MSRSLSDLPLARVPNEKSGNRKRPCIHCGKDLVLSRWEDWNGFLVICPHCKKVHGQPWNVKAILWGSFFFHPFSFFFTMRPTRALIAVVLWTATAFLGNYFFSLELLPQLVDTALTIGFLFMPMAINGMLILRHQTLLNKPQTGKKNAFSLLENVSDFFLS